MSPEQYLSRDPREKLVAYLRDQALQALDQEAAIQRLALAGQQVAKGSLYKIDGGNLKIRLEVPSEDKDLTGDPYLPDQPVATPELSENDVVFFKETLGLPAIWVLFPINYSGDKPMSLEQTVSAAEEIQLYIENPGETETEIVLIKNGHLESSKFILENPEQDDDAQQKQHAEQLYELASQHLNLRTLGVSRPDNPTAA